VRTFRSSKTPGSGVFQSQRHLLFYERYVNDMSIATETQAAAAEKNSAALMSVLASVGLATFKLIIGLLTGSLGILAEAAHSTLDLVAALVTFFAVHLSGKPADKEHPYGHGKIENLSALFETLLLLGTCVWIIYEAVNRLFFHPVEVETSIWSFVVMITSIVIDINRSANLGKAAKKHNSQALEADALHFSTDIYSSAVVIFGLIGVVVANNFPAMSFLKHADAIAALGVAVIVIWISMQLGKRTVMALLDTAPDGMAEEIKTTVEKITGVCNCHQVRIHPSGSSYYIDAHVYIDGNTSLTEAHALTEKIEKAIQRIVPSSDITVHPEPVPQGYKPEKEIAH
jgi:cation diffusion facilitator family transporter